MPITATDIVNQSVWLIGDDVPPVTGTYPNFDGSKAGKAAAILYPLTVRAVARQFGWDFARSLVSLVLTGNAAPLGFSYEYTYPGNGVEVWQLMPPQPLADPNNPVPVDWTVGNTLVADVQTKVIWSNQQDAVAAYNNVPTENTWDSLFQQAVVRLLASAMAMALKGKPDIAAAMLESGSAFESLGETRAG
jgi:hypothetical protein